MGDKLIKRRAGHKSYVSQLITRIETELKKEEISHDELHASTSELNRQRQLILELDSQIAEEIEDSKIESEFAEAGDLQIKIDLALQKVEKLKSSPSRPKNSDYYNVKLPKVFLARFSGNPIDYTQFWDLFNSSIHKRTDISNVVKFQYLLT